MTGWWCGDSHGYSAAWRLCFWDSKLTSLLAPGRVTLGGRVTHHGSSWRTCPSRCGDSTSPVLAVPVLVIPPHTACRRRTSTQRCVRPRATTRPTYCAMQANTRKTTCSTTARPTTRTISPTGSPTTRSTLPHVPHRANSISRWVSIGTPLN